MFEVKQGVTALRLLLNTILGIFAGLQSMTLLAGCPLEGTWDTGFVKSQAGGSYVRVTHTFDCEGNTVQRAYYTRGLVLQVMAEVNERTGTYSLGEPISGTEGLRPVDIDIKTVTKRHMDPSSLAMGGCVPADASIVMPYVISGEECDKAVYPEPGFFERAVVKLDGETFYWSYFYADEILVIQSADSPVKRNLSVDAGLPYRRSP